VIKDSITQVAAGSKFVAQSGQTIEESVKSIPGVTVMISERSFASAEQTAGILQVNQALARRMT
jgi:methyl-accepting chemotaxis protein